MLLEYTIALYFLGTSTQWGKCRYVSSHDVLWHWPLTVSQEFFFTNFWNIHFWLFGMKLKIQYLSRWIPQTVSFLITTYTTADRPSARRIAVWPNWAIFKSSLNTYWRFGCLQNTIFELKATVATFWTTFGKNCATFYSNIRSHWVTDASRPSFLITLTQFC